MRNKFCTLALTGFLTLGFAGGAAFAQDQTQTAPPESNNTNMAPMHHQHRRMNSDRQLKRMTKQLDLSADQQTQIKPILDSRNEQMQQLRQDKTTSREDRREKMQGIQQDTNQKIEAVLNDTQKQKFEADQAKMKEHMNRHHMHQQQNSTPQESAPESQPQ